MSTSISKRTRRTFTALPITTAKPSAPARHRVTEHTLPQHMAKYLIKSVSASQRKSR